MAQRQYEATQIFNARIVDMRHLWTPSMEYMGKPSQKPNYFAGFIVQKTQAHWSTEPIFGGVMQGFGKLLTGQLQAYAQNPNAVIWPIVDGDLPSPTTQKVSEHAKGHWLFSGSTNSPPTTELVQAGGTLVKLQNKVGVKSGDFVMVGVTAAVKATQANAVKFYLNAVVFTSPGEEIVFANSVSGAELMRMAEQQGLRPTGFSASPGGFPGGGAPIGGFSGAVAPGGFGGAPQGGFTPPAGGFTPNPGQPAFGGAQAPNGGGFGGNAQFPSNPGQGAPGFTPQSPGFQPGGVPNSTTIYPSNPAPQWPQR